MAVDDSYTKSLLHFDGNLTDESGRTWAAYNGAENSEVQKKFGSGSLHVPAGAAGALIRAQSDQYAAITFTGMFSIAFWIYQVNAYVIAYAGTWGGDFLGIQTTDNNTAAVLGFQLGGWNPSTAPLPAGWSHIEFSRDENNLASLYLNGTSIVSATKTGTYVATRNVLTIGADFDVSGGNGEFFIDEFICVTGEYFHNSNFTPPTAPYGAPVRLCQSIGGF